MKFVFTKSRIFKAGSFVLGVIITLLLTRAWNIAFPEDPLIIKEITDSVKVVHEYRLPSNTDSTTEIMEKKLKNLRLLNDYEDEIDRRIRRINNIDSSLYIPNLIEPAIGEKYKYKGYSSGDPSAYFSTEWPDLNRSKYLDFKIKFFNPRILKKIAFLRLSILRYESHEDKKVQVYEIDEYYEVNTENRNFIRIENNFKPGKYQFLIGFILSKDVKNKYPKFYHTKCTLIKN